MRRVQFGLVGLYNQNDQFSDLIQMISTLSLVPQEDIDAAWLVIKIDFLT